LSEVYSEPSWTHQLIHERKSPKRIDPSEGVIVKYPSGLCHLASLIGGPKIFLYRNLGEHLLKLRANIDSTYIDYYYEYCRLYCHPILRDLRTESLLEKHVFLWAHRFLWVNDSDVTFVKSVDFFTNPEKEFHKICQHFGIVPPEKLNLPSFNVKSAGYNHQNAQLKEIVPQSRTPVRPKEGIIPLAVIESSSMVQEAREWVRSNLFIDDIFL
jgi:hypothetical protein